MKEPKIEELKVGEYDGIDFEESADTKEETAKSGSLRVYRKKSTFKGAKDTDFWYSATRSDGNSVSVIFKCPIETDSVAFEISNVVGTLKQKTVTKGEDTYTNFTYYVSSCDFNEIKGEPLPL